MGTDDDGAKKTKKRRRISSDEYRSITPVGIAEHTDFEAFTLLHQTRPGLELKDLAGTWRDASCAPESSTFTVIIADVMERWTGGLLTATPHRVAFTPHERLSLVRFNGLDPGTVVETLPAFRGRPSPTHRAATTTQGEHVGRMVTAAAKNLEDMLETYPKRALTTNPRRFAQLIVTRGREARSIIGSHTTASAW
jgi:isopenicillin N synthase-like dioxygenase|tara:strand:+ start:72 stop:656 length:585 start_codon:yes stop_codon:yes gene_type:complete